MRCFLIALAALSVTADAAEAMESASFRGSRGSMIRQHAYALEADYSFLRTARQVERFVEEGYLVPLEGNTDYGLANVSFPYARPEMRLFVERLSSQHREACGEKLVVTSLTRPTSRQPGNSHRLSVHPTGMAIDLRVLDKGECVAWTRDVLISLERAGVLDVTRERRPPHFHVALFTGRYAEYVAPLIEKERREAAAEAARLAQAQRRISRARVAAAGFLPAGESVLASPADAESLDWGRSLLVLSATLLLAMLLRRAGVRI